MAQERMEPVPGPAGSPGPADLTGAPDDLGREPGSLAGVPGNGVRGNADLAGQPRDLAGEPVAAPRQGGEPAALDALANTPFVDDQAQVRQKWQEIQSAFVDDPRGSVTRAADLADTVVQSLVATVEERKRALRGTWDGGEADTEQLRNTLRRYRVLIDRLSSV